MKVTKQQIINGVVKYTKNEVLNKIVDKPLKMIIATVVAMMETNPKILDNVFNNSMLSSMLYEEDGMYEIDELMEVVEDIMNEYGEFPVTIPAIKFISPMEKELSFGASDIKKLREYITSKTVKPARGGSE